MGGFEGLVEVGFDVVDVLETDGDADEVGRQAAGALGFFAELLVAGGDDYDEPREELLRQNLASTPCRGRQTLTELAAQLGPITLGSLTRARQKMEENLAEDATL